MATSAEVDRILATIRSRESSNNYTAQNPVSSASGAYQFINGTWKTWRDRAIAAGLIHPDAARWRTAKEATPKVQDTVARLNVQSILDSAGGRIDAVPRAWYTGNPGAPDSYQPSGPGNEGVTVGRYVQGWMADYQRNGGDVSDVFGDGGSPLIPTEAETPPGSATNRDTGPPEGASDDEVKAWARDNYGYLSAWLDHGELGPVLLDAARRGLGEAQLFGLIYNTEWWQTTTDAQRSWDDKVRRDPATANRERDEAKRKIGDQAMAMGVPLNADQVAKIAEDTLMFGWEQGMVTDQIMAQVSSANVGAGTLTATADTLRAIYGQNLIRSSEAALLNQASRIQRGEQTMEGVRSYIQNEARSRWANNANILSWIDSGGTVADYFAGARSEVAAELEIDPTEINLMDRQWGWVTEVPDGQGGVRQPTINEVRKRTRADDRWKGTNGFGEMASAIGSQVDRWLGF